MTLTDKLTVVANALITKFQTAAALGPTNPLVAITANQDGTIPAIQSTDIYYGDQTKIPRVPSLCVEPSDKNRDFEGASRPATTRNALMVFFLIYHAGPEDQVARRQTDEIGEAVEALVHLDPQLNNGGSSPTNDLVISSLCTVSQSGYTYRNNTLYRSVRITWVGNTKTRLS